MTLEHVRSFGNGLQGTRGSIGHCVSTIADRSRCLFKICIFALSSLGALTGAPKSLAAQAAWFVGTWKNTPAATRGVTTLQIAVERGAATVRVWGSCHGAECLWGEVPADIYAKNIEASIATTANVITARFVDRMSEKLLVIHATSVSHLSVEILTRYLDGSGRNSTSDTQQFVRISKETRPPANTMPLAAKRSRARR